MPNKNFSKKQFPERVNNVLTNESRNKLLNLIELVREGKTTLSTVIRRDKYRLTELRAIISEIANPEKKEQLVEKLRIFERTIKKNSAKNRDKRKKEEENSVLDKITFKKERLKYFLYLVTVDEMTIGTITKNYNYLRHQVRTAINEVENEKIKKLLFEKWENFIIKENKNISEIRKKNKRSKKLKNITARKAKLPFDSLIIAKQKTGMCSVSTMSSELLLASAAKKENNITQLTSQLPNCSNSNDNDEQLRINFDELWISNNPNYNCANSQISEPSGSGGAEYWQPFFSKDTQPLMMPLDNMSMNCNSFDTANNLLPTIAPSISTTSTTIGEKEIIRNFENMYGHLTTQKSIEPANTVETNLLTLFDPDKGYNHKEFVNNYFDLKSYNAKLQQAPVSTDMNWEVFTATNDIPQMLPASTKTSFDELRIPNNFVYNNGQLNQQKINEISFNEPAPSENTSFFHFYY